MSVTYKDIDLLSQKSSVAGTEKLPVSDTEFITPSQIVSGVRADLNILLEHVDWSGLTVVYRFIDPSNKWASGNNPRCVFVPLVPGKKYSVKYETSGTIAILQDSSSTIGDTPNWATGFVGRIVITDEYNFVAPPDAHYMYLLTGYNGVVYTPEYITALENGSVTDVTLGGTSVLSQGVAVLPAYPTTLPASDVYAWAKAATKPSYTASEVGALPDSTVIPTVPTNVSAFTNDAHYLKYYLCADEAEYNAIQNKDSGTLYLIPES